jgi:hypothetical protein
MPILQINDFDGDEPQTNIKKRSTNQSFRNSYFIFNHLSKIINIIQPKQKLSLENGFKRELYPLITNNFKLNSLYYKNVKNTQYNQYIKNTNIFNNQHSMQKNIRRLNQQKKILNV